MSNYSIRDVEHLTGIQAHTIRVWEQRYKLFCPERTETNIRTYSDDNLKLLLNIALLNKAGYKIGHIAKMSAAQMNMYLLNIGISENVRLELIIKDLTLAMIELDEDKFEKILQKSILQNSFEEVMLQIIYPFLSRIGIMWSTRNISPAQEHFITNLIRQKIIVAIDGQSVQKKTDAKHFLLFLPENELHELSLLFLNYLLKSRQQKVTYLGMNVPLKDLLETIKICKPDYLYTILTTSLNPNALGEYIKKAAYACNDKPFFISGQYAAELPITMPPNIKVFSDLPAVLVFINSLYTNSN